jgi:hypothetical protein
VEMILKIPEKKKSDANRKSSMFAKYLKQGFQML